MTAITIRLTAGASKALALAAAKRGITPEDFVKRATCENACAELYGSKAESEPEIAEMFLRENISAQRRETNL